MYLNHKNFMLFYVSQFFYLSPFENKTFYINYYSIYTIVLYQFTFSPINGNFLKNKLNYINQSIL